jgi:hypothetical protein
VKLPLEVKLSSRSEDPLFAPKGEVIPQDFNRDCSPLRSELSGEQFP